MSAVVLCTKHVVRSSLSVKTHDDPSEGFTSMFDIKVYFVGDDGSLGCLCYWCKD